MTVTSLTHSQSHSINKELHIQQSYNTVIAVVKQVYSKLDHYLGFLGFNKADSLCNRFGTHFQSRGSECAQLPCCLDSLFWAKLTKLGIMAAIAGTNVISVPSGSKLCILIDSSFVQTLSSIFNLTIESHYRNRLSKMPISSISYTGTSQYNKIPLSMASV